MKNFLNKNKRGVLVFLYLLGIILLINYFLVPNIEKMKRTSNQIQEKKMDKKILESRLSNLSTMEKQANIFLENKEQLGKIINNSEEVDFIKYLEELAQKTRNKIEIKIPESQFKNDKSSKKINISIDGGKEILSKLRYKNFLIMEVVLIGNFQKSFDFIGELENSSYYSNVITMNMEKIEKNERINQSLSMFSFSQEGEKLPNKYLKTELKLIVYKNEL